MLRQRVSVEYHAPWVGLIEMGSSWIECSRSDDVPTHRNGGNDVVGSRLEEGDEEQTRLFRGLVPRINEITRSVHLGALDLDREGKRISVSLLNIAQEAWSSRSCGHFARLLYI